MSQFCCVTLRGYEMIEAADVAEARRLAEEMFGHSLLEMPQSDLEPWAVIDPTIKYDDPVAQDRSRRIISGRGDHQGLRGYQARTGIAE